MISFLLDVEDLADTRFALSPLREVMGSLRALRAPALYPLHRPWRASVLRDLVPRQARFAPSRRPARPLAAPAESPSTSGPSTGPSGRHAESTHRTPLLDGQTLPAGALDPADARLLAALVGPTLALPDFLTPRPTTFAPTIDEQLAVVRATPGEVVRRDLTAVHAPGPLPEALRAVTGPGAAPSDRLCQVLLRYWEFALLPSWPRMRLVLEADITYRARQLATGGAHLLFADLHPNLRWDGGVLRIDKMIGRHQVDGSGRGLRLVPSLFAHKPAPPVSAAQPPMLADPSRGAATLWEPVPEPDASALSALLGAPRTTVLRLLAEPLPTVEIARRLGVTPSAVSQHLKVLHATGLVSRARDGRRVLYRRSALGDQLTEH